jgi:hypothetical protein
LSLLERRVLHSSTASSPAPLVFGEVSVQLRRTVGPHLPPLDSSPPNTPITPTLSLPTTPRFHSFWRKLHSSYCGLPLHLASPPNISLRRCWGSTLCHIWFWDSSSSVHRISETIEAEQNNHSTLAPWSETQITFGGTLYLPNGVVWFQPRFIPPKKEKGFVSGNMTKGTLRWIRVGVVDATAQQVPPAWCTYLENNWRPGQSTMKSARVRSVKADRSRGPQVASSK